MLNYITTLMPQTIDRISGTITDWSASSIIQDSKITINTVPSTNQTIIFTSHSTEGVMYTITLTALASVADGGHNIIVAGDNAATGNISSKSTTTSNAATSIHNAITAINTAITDDVGFTTTLDNNIITISTTDAHSVTVSGTYITSSNVTVGHPHFLMEFLIINRD